MNLPVYESGNESVAMCQICINAYGVLSQNNVEFSSVWPFFVTLCGVVQSIACVLFFVQNDANVSGTLCREGCVMFALLWVKFAQMYPTVCGCIIWCFTRMWSLCHVVWSHSFHRFCVVFWFQNYANVSGTLSQNNVIVLSFVAIFGTLNKRDSKLLDFRSTQLQGISSSARYLRDHSKLLPTEHFFVECGGGGGGGYFFLKMAWG